MMRSTIGALAIALILATFASAETAVNEMKIVAIGQDFYDPFMKSCAAALKAEASKRGIRAEIRQNFPKDDEIAKSDAVIYLTPSTTLLSALENKPKGYDALTSVGMFASPEHFMKFAQSDFYENMFIPYHNEIFPVDASVMGVAYGSTAQIFTEDKPSVYPKELSGRTMFAMFNTWWYSDDRIKGELNVVQAGNLGWADSTAKLKEIEEKISGDFGADQRFVIMPVVAAFLSLPPKMRAFMSKSMTTTVLVTFHAYDWPDMTQPKRLLVKDIIDSVRISCSEKNIKDEELYIAKMKQTGTKVFGVDIEAFQNLAKLYLVDKLASLSKTIAKNDALSGWKDESERSQKSYEKEHAIDDLNLYQEIQKLK